MANEYTVAEILAICHVSFVFGQLIGGLIRFYRPARHGFLCPSLLPFAGEERFARSSVFHDGERHSRTMHGTIMKPP
jgi:hypothetical protein